MSSSDGYLLLANVKKLILGLKACFTPSEAVIFQFLIKLFSKNWEFLRVCKFSFKAES